MVVLLDRILVLHSILAEVLVGRLRRILQAPRWKRKKRKKKMGDST